MFYSHTVLGRKGPLGTVWIAAHLQHKLRKTQYMSTDIRSLAEQIMFPDVPIALRMSGHLLLGLVRIYSKKVEYLFQDCNLSLSTLKTAFVSGEDVNLLPNAGQAQFNAVTFPTSYELDAVNIDYYLQSLDETQDNHIGNYEQITLSIDEEQVTSNNEEAPETFADEVTHPEAPQYENVPMEEGTVLPLAENDNAGVGNPQGDDNMNIEDETEIMRSADTNLEHQLVDIPLLQHGQDTPRASSSGIHINEEMQIPDLDLENSILITSRGRSPASLQPFSNLTGSPLQLSHTPFELGGNSPNLEIQPSPAQQQPQLQLQHQQPRLPPRPRPRRRNPKRKLMDETLVISNESLKHNLNDFKDIVRKKKRLPCAARDTWWCNTKKKMEQSFQEPSFTDMSSELIAIQEEGSIRSHPNLNWSEEELRDNVASTSKQTPNPVEIPRDFPSTSKQTPDPVEILRDDAHENQIPHSPEILRDAAQENQILQSPEVLRDAAHENPFPQMFETILSPVPESPQTNRQISPVTSTGTRILPTFETVNYTVGMETDKYTIDMETDNRTLGSEMETPARGLDFGQTPTFFDADLTFLENDSSTPAGSPSVQGNETLSARTRRVAQIFMEKCSPSLSSSSESSLSGGINLNTVLEGRSRKLSARMIFDTLTLKDRGLVDVQQNSPYGDIIVRVTSRMSKDQF